MSILFRLPFYIVGCIFWIFFGGIITMFQWMFLPAAFFLALLFPSLKEDFVTNIVTLKTLRKGFSNLNIFLKGY